VSEEPVWKLKAWYKGRGLLGCTKEFESAAVHAEIAEEPLFQRCESEEAEAFDLFLILKVLTLTELDQKYIHSLWQALK